MRGRFTPDASAEELLSRIHHYTLKRLRAEIEPVAARDFLRFLFDWQHVSADARMAGPKALDGVAAQLEGFEAAAVLGRARFCRRGSLAMNRDGSMSAASLAISFGRVCASAMAGPMAAEGRHRCAPPPCFRRPALRELLASYQSNSSVVCHDGQTVPIGDGYITLSRAPPVWDIIN
jgi:ATP-dependent Lhr-like helicase